MTDTPDIAALRDVKRWGVVATGDQYFKFVTKNISDGPYVKQEDYFALFALLEAERQRADAARKTCDMYRDKFLSAEAEIAALKAKLANQYTPVGFLFVVNATGQVVYSVSNNADIEGATLVGQVYGEAAGLRLGGA